VTRTTLRLRRDHPELFTGYRPLPAPDHLVAFTRADDHLAVIVTRLTTPAPPDGPPIDLPPGPWHDLLSDTPHPGGPTTPADLLATEPHALLVRT
jgi:(1->4)-alpha-D-glucan 1-alpha-D-glucosylmutase